VINKHKWHLLLLFNLALLLASSVVACETSPSSPSPAITVGPASISFSAQQDGANPASQTLSIWNSGGRALNWFVSDNADWLSLSPTNGVSAGEIDNVTLSVDIAGMKAGSYGAVITISASEATNTPQTVAMNLTINPPAVEEEKVIDALDTDRLLDIGYNHPEKVVTVEGIIVRTHYAKNSKGQPTFLDFHDPYEGYFKCIIWKEDRQTGEPIRDKFIEAFPPNPETYFLNKKVRVKGTINIYHRWRNNVCLSEPEIILNDPSQIWIVE
jgi:hypothetical protein